MNFSTPSKVLATIRAGDEVEAIRGENRAKVNDLFNSVPPLSDDEARRCNLRINSDFGEGAVLAAHGRRQYNDAILGGEIFFKVSIPTAPPEHRTDWEITITNELSDIMKESEEYDSLKENQFASVLAHGIGAQLWYSKDDWMPEFVAVEDLRVPTDTQTSLKNLPWFAVRKQYTQWELANRVFGKHSAQGWKKKVIATILDRYKEENVDTNDYTWTDSPEKMHERWKQDGGFYSSDAVPSIPLWHFYFCDDSDRSNPVWKLVVVPDWGMKCYSEVENEFLYKSDKPVARKLSEFISIQFGDLNNKAPFMYHSVRSLGFLLVEPCFWTNLARCRGLQHTMEMFNIWLRVQDPEGRAKAQKIELFDRALLPEGVSIVPNTERHTVDPTWFNNMMAQLRQLQSEASQSYTQKLEDGGKREQTAFETRVKLASVNAMVSGLLRKAFRKEKFAYREICRRFCLSNSSNRDVVRFQKTCKDAGIPRMFVNVERWKIQPEIPVGGGNPTMAAAQAQELLAIRPLLPPTAQQEVLHEVVSIFSGDPRRAQRWVPLDGKQGVTSGQSWASAIFGTLMQGVPVAMQEGLSPIDQAETLLGLMAGVVARIQGTTEVGTPTELAGLQTVGAYVSQLIQRLSMDPAQKERVKLYSDQLGGLMNMVKAFAQRAQEAAQQNSNGNGGISPEDQAKITGMLMAEQTKSKIKEAQAAQKMEQKQREFDAAQDRKDAETIAQIGRDTGKTVAQIQAERMRGEGDKAESE